MILKEKETLVLNGYPLLNLHFLAAGGGVGDLSPPPLTDAATKNAIFFRAPLLNT